VTRAEPKYRGAVRCAQTASEAKSLTQGLEGSASDKSSLSVDRTGFLHDKLMQLFGRVPAKKSLPDLVRVRYLPTLRQLTRIDNIRR